LLRTKKLSRLELVRPLQLVSLRGANLRRIGADARLCVGDHDVAQAWSRAIHLHPRLVDGICYVARHDPSQVSVAIFARAAAALRARAAEEVLAGSLQRRLLEDLLARYDLALEDEDDEVL
jgi:hypothetical protein